MIWVWVLTHFVVHELSFDLTHFLSEFTTIGTGDGYHHR